MWGSVSAIISSAIESSSSIFQPQVQESQRDEFLEEELKSLLDEESHGQKKPGSAYEEKGFFDKVLSHYKNEEGNLVSIHDPRLVLPWSRDGFCNIIRTLASQAISQEFYTPCVINRREFFVIKEHGSVGILEPSAKEKIDSSHPIFRIFNIMTGRLGPVYQILSKELIPRQRKAHAIIQLCHDKEPALGIPRMKLVKQGNKITGIISPDSEMRYLIDVDRLAIRVDNVIRGIWQLLSGLKCMFDHKVVRCNIRPAKITISKEKNEDYINFYFADFATAQRITETTPDEDLGVPPLIKEEEGMAIHAAWIEKNGEKYWNLQHKVDVLALGGTLEWLFTKNQIPKEIQPILERMQCVAAQRFTAEQALEQLQVVIDKRYPLFFITHFSSLIAK